MTTQLNIQMADAYDGFILAKRAKGLSASTIYLYEWTLHYWQQRWGKMTLGDVTAGHVRTWLIWLQGKDDFPAPIDQEKLLSSRSVHTHFRNLSAFWTWCEREELIERSPMTNVETPGFDEKIPDCLTEDEMQYLLRKVRGNEDRNAYRDYCIHLFFLATGVRLAELAGLSLNDVDLRNGYARVTGKGRKERMVSLGEVLPLELKRYTLKYRAAPPDEKALFVNERGARCGRSGIQEMIARDLKKYIPRKLTKTGPHTLRHTWFTLRLRQTKDLKGTSMAGGHTDTRVTERYVHLALNDFTRGEDGRAYSPVDSILRKNRNGRKGDTLQKSNENHAVIVSS